MSQSRSLELLLRIRRAEEEDSRRVMETAIAELRRLEDSLRSVSLRATAGRARVVAAVISGSSVDRIAAQQEIQLTERLKDILVEKIDRANMEVSELRQDYLTRRMERRQVEALLESLREQEAQETRRTEQKTLDEWHRSSSHGRSPQQKHPQKGKETRGQETTESW